MHIGGEGSWDYVTVDPGAKGLFVPRRTHTMVVDSASGKIVGDIPGQKIAHGVALVPALNRVPAVIPQPSFSRLVTR